MESMHDATTFKGREGDAIVVDEFDGRESGSGLNRHQRRALAKLKRIDGKLSKKIDQLQKRNER